MDKTFNQGKDEVAKLCQYFANNHQEFLAPGVKEAHVRQILIDPFFEALGWDVRNTDKVAPQYREVMIEDSLDVEGHQKAPDYSFRVGTLPKFYTEAKKCGINISADPAPAYQLRRYGWSAKVVLSILTDFEEFSIYDCTKRPNPKDKASYSRLQYYHFEQYPDCWREIWDVFSREAVWSGAFDKHSASKRKRGTSEVDTEFLKEIEGWRDTLARNIALRNKDLSSDDLNAAVQRTIDRIVFLRMAEDRGIEPYEQLLKLCERPNIYKRFMSDLCNQADEKYNSGLFHFQKEKGISEAPDQITPKLKVDDNTLKPILKNLYFVHGSPYHFGVLPVEILGTVYERFLGKVIRLTAGHQAKIEEKPEVRKAGGVYYTPSYIVDYIVKNTVGVQVEGKSPKQLAGGKNKEPFRVLDMACGSGSFLLGAYKYLLDHCMKWYTAHNPTRYKKAVYKTARNGQWNLTIQEKKRILTTHIFGVDIDHQAVEVSKLSLLLKVLEGETDQTIGQQMQLFHERALPNLAKNIKCGNSLIGPDYFASTLIPDSNEIKRVNPFDWNKEFPDAMETGGFDIVTGNPPYIGFHGFMQDKTYLKDQYVSAVGKFDIYIPFIEAGIRILSSKGFLGFICPTNFMKRNHGKQLRNYLLNNTMIREICDFQHQQIFVGATNYTGIFIFEKRSPTKGHSFIYKLDNIDAKGMLAKQNELDYNPWVIRDEKSKGVVERIRKESTSILSEITEAIAEGIVTGKNNVYLISASDVINLHLEKDLLRPCIRGKQIKRYLLEEVSEYVVYPYKQIENKTKVIEEKDLKIYERLWAYLNNHKTDLAGRPYFEKSTKLWYELWCQRDLKNLSQNKIVVPELSEMNRFAIADCHQFYGDTACGITLLPSVPESIFYILGLLNSRLIEYFYKNTTVPKAGGYYIYKTMFLNNIPIRRIDFSNNDEESKHNHLVRLVNSILVLNTQLSAAKSQNQKISIQRQIDATETKINQFVYDLYGLTANEINIVEGNNP